MSYTPPDSAWNLRDFIEAPLATIKKRTVDCSNCPVNLACTAGDGGTQYTCRRCGSTGYFTTESQRTPSEDFRTYLILDCNKHKFPPGQYLESCTLCTGDIMHLYVRTRTPSFFYVYTVNAGVPIKTRLKVLQESYAHWTKLTANEKG